MFSIKPIITALALSLTLGACADQAAPTPTPESTPAVGHLTNDTDQFTVVDADTLAALPAGERYVIDLRPEGAAFAVKFATPADLARVSVVDYDEVTGEPDEYVLAERAPLAEAQQAGTVIFGHGDMKVIEAGDRGGVCIQVCCWHWLCFVEK